MNKVFPSRARKGNDERRYLLFLKGEIKNVFSFCRGDYLNFPCPFLHLQVFVSALLSLQGLKVQSFHFAEYLLIPFSSMVLVSCFVREGTAFHFTCSHYAFTTVDCPRNSHSLQKKADVLMAIEKLSERLFRSTLQSHMESAVRFPGQ